MDIQDEPSVGLDDTDFEAFNRIQQGADAIKATAQAIAPALEADTVFYQRVIDHCKSSIESLDEQMKQIDEQAQALLDSKKKLFSDRQRLASQRNAARIAIRALEDSEARQQASRG